MEQSPGHIRVFRSGARWGCESISWPHVDGEAMYCKMTTNLFVNLGKDVLSSSSTKSDRETKAEMIKLSYEVGKSLLVDAS
jgi:hypothetical protein